MQFYPLQGRIAAEDPSLVIEAKMENVQGTFVIGSDKASGSGQATDTNSNVYKLLF